MEIQSSKDEVWYADLALFSSQNHCLRQMRIRIPLVSPWNPLLQTPVTATAVRVKLAESFSKGCRERSSLTRTSDYHPPPPPPHHHHHHHHHHHREAGEPVSFSHDISKHFWNTLAMTTNGPIQTHDNLFINWSRRGSSLFFCQKKYCSLDITPCRRHSQRNVTWNDWNHQQLFWLVVWTPLKNISQLGCLFPIYGKIKHVPNHQPVLFNCISCCIWEDETAEGRGSFQLPSCIQPLVLPRTSANRTDPGNAASCPPGRFTLILLRFSPYETYKTIYVYVYIYICIYIYIII